MPFREEGIVYGIVETDETVVDTLEVGSLQIGMPRRGVEIVAERLKHPVGITINMDESRLWKHFEQEPDSRCMGRRFEHERPAVLVRELLQEPGEGGFP